jgi:hypothetical protein
LNFEQELPGGRRRDRGFLQAEVGRLRPPLGAGGEDDLAGSHVDISRKGFPPTGCFGAVVLIGSLRRRLPVAAKIGSVTARTIEVSGA